MVRRAPGSIGGTNLIGGAVVTELLMYSVNRHAPTAQRELPRGEIEGARPNQNVIIREMSTWIGFSLTRSRLLLIETAAAKSGLTHG